MTTAILTPKTPVCFREGILFKLNSLLVNLMESFTSICRGRQGHGPLTLLGLTVRVPRGLGGLVNHSPSPSKWVKIPVQGRSLAQLSKN